MPGGTSSLPREQNAVDYLRAILKAWNNEPSLYELNCLAEFTKLPETDHDAFCGVLYDLRTLSYWEYMRNALIVIDHCTINGSDKFKEHAKGNVFRLISLVWRTAGGAIGNTHVVREKVQKLVQLMQPDFMDDLQRSTGIIGTQYGAYSATLSQASRLLQPGVMEGDYAKMLYKLQQSFAILHAFTFLVFDPPPNIEMGSYAGTSSPQLPSAIVDLLMGIGNYASHIHREPSARARLRKASGVDAQCIVDGLQAVLTAYAENNIPTSRASVLRLLQDVCSTANILPQDYWLTDIEKAERIERGGEAVIVKGFLRRESNRIAIVLRIYRKPDMDHKREVITQRQLRHPNILQLLGVFAMSDSRIAIVAPWAPGGDAVAFVEEHTGPDCFMRLLLGVSSAVCYIHGLKPEVIHGDIRGANILVDEHGDPLLGDFGLSRNKHEPTRSLTNIIGTGYWRHQPPELLYGPSKPRTTQQSDIYAFAMTIYELGTRSVPFEGQGGAFSVMRKIIGGAHPDRPEKLGDLDSPIADSLWDLMGGMWKEDAKSRPLAGQVRESLVQINVQRMSANIPASTSATHATVPKASPTSPTTSHEVSPVPSLATSLKSMRLSLTPERKAATPIPAEGSIERSRSARVLHRAWSMTRCESLGGHEDKVVSVAYPSTGNEFASGSSDGHIRIWSRNRQSHPGTWSYRLPERNSLKKVSCISSSFDARFLAAGTFTKIKLWDMNTGQSAGSFNRHEGAVTAITSSPARPIFASGSKDKTAFLWDARTRVSISKCMTGHRNEVTCIAFSPSGEMVASTSLDGTIRLWDVRLDRWINQLITVEYKINGLSYSPDGRCLAAACEDHKVYRWDATTLGSIGTCLVGHQAAVKCLTFSPDGTQIASGSVDNTIRIWDASSGASMRLPLEGHTGTVESIAFSADGEHMVSGSRDRTVKVWTARHVSNDESG